MAEGQLEEFGWGSGQHPALALDSAGQLMFERIALAAILAAQVKHQSHEEEKERVQYD